ncbi:MAG: hypothetical protein FJ010_12730 [Chloroflexi bacterium]|nr:hypothetical protein [Chloroflexota bacterium]
MNQHKPTNTLPEMTRQEIRDGELSNGDPLRDSLVTELPFGLEGKAYRSPMPFSMYDPLNEVWDAYLERSVDVVVVLTEPQEYLVHAHRDLSEFYHSAGMDVIRLPIQDFRTPQYLTELNTTLEAVENHLRAGRNVAIHCLAGLGRTGTFLACLASRILQIDGKNAIEWVRKHVPGALENPFQEQFVISHT